MPRLIINADDFGVFACVSRGILEAVRAGVVTAVGVMATGRAFAMASELSRERNRADVGAHLVLTAGEPLTSAMRSACAPWGGGFPGKGAAAAAVLMGRLKLATVEEEWEAQLALCRQVVPDLVFLNSHEHIHMLPPLFALARRLAARHSIRFVRAPRTAMQLPMPLPRLLKGMIFKGLSACVGPCPEEPVLLGTGESGRLSPQDLARIVRGLAGDGPFELMCHPGRFDGQEINDPRLMAFHDWEGELCALLSPDFRRLLTETNTRLIRYSDLTAA